MFIFLQAIAISLDRKEFFSPGIFIAITPTIIFLSIIIFTSYVNAACEDVPANEVDWTNCNFIDQTDLSGVSLAGANMTGVNLSVVNLEKSRRFSYGAPKPKKIYF